MQRDRHTDTHEHDESRNIIQASKLTLEHGTGNVERKVKQKVFHCVGGGGERSVCVCVCVCVSVYVIIQLDDTNV